MSCAEPPLEEADPSSTFLCSFLQAMSTAQINRARVQGEPPDPCSLAAAMSLGKERSLKHSCLSAAPPQGSDALLIPPLARAGKRDVPSEKEDVHIHCDCFAFASSAEAGGCSPGGNTMFSTAGTSGCSCADPCSAQSTNLPHWQDHDFSNMLPSLAGLHRARSAGLHALTHLKASYPS